MTAENEPSTLTTYCLRWLMPMLVVIVLTGVETCPAEGRPLVVFAAVSLMEPLLEIRESFVAQSNDEIRFSFASSSTLARQIAAGANASLYFSANRAWMDYLLSRGLIESSSVTSPLTNRLVIVTPLDSPISPFKLNKQSNLLQYLSAGDRIAIGDPDHVPAGIYAAQALQSLDLWQSLAPLIARTDNTRAALALVERGESPFGIVYQTDAEVSNRVRVVSQIMQQLHDPITYQLAIVKDTDTKRVRKFYTYLLSDAALAVFVRHGFQSN